jgi:hypothetical protein
VDQWKTGTGLADRPCDQRVQISCGLDENLGILIENILNEAVEFIGMIRKNYGTS